MNGKFTAEFGPGWIQVGPDAWCSLPPDNPADVEEADEDGPYVWPDGWVEIGHVSDDSSTDLLDRMIDPTPVNTAKETS